MYFNSSPQGGTTNVDQINSKIIACLQEDAMMPIAKIAERAGISPSPCWRRIQKLLDDGVILRRVALLDPYKINAGVNVFVSIRTHQHSLEWARKFCRVAAQIPEVVEFYRMSGRVDYLLRVVVPNIAAYDEVYKKLIKAADLYDVTSSFAMETIKYTTCLPLHYATDPS
jgi:Lrp/AsnC family transcriptional regulator